VDDFGLDIPLQGLGILCQTQGIIPEISHQPKINLSVRPYKDTSSLTLPSDEPAVLAQEAILDDQLPCKSHCGSRPHPCQLQLSFLENTSFRGMTLGRDDKTDKFIAEAIAADNPQDQRKADS